MAWAAGQPDVDHAPGRLHQVEGQRRQVRGVGGVDHRVKGLVREAVLRPGVLEPEVRAYAGTRPAIHQVHLGAGGPGEHRHQQPGRHRPPALARAAGLRAADPGARRALPWWSRAATLACRAGCGPRAGDRALVLGPGTIGLLAAMFARAAGAEVHLMGRSEESLAFARSLGFEHVWTQDSLPDQPFDAVIDASNAAHLPALALNLVEPAGRVVYIGLAGSPSHIDTRTLALKDVTAVGFCQALLVSTPPSRRTRAVPSIPGRWSPPPSASSRSAPCSRERPEAAGPGPKIHVDPLLS